MRIKKAFIFVVKDNKGFDESNYKELEVSDTFMECTLKRLFTTDKKCSGAIDEDGAEEELIYEGKGCVKKAKKCNAPSSFMLYKGANYNEKEKFNGMFSFFPCKVFEEGKGFKRPNLEQVDKNKLLNNEKASGVSYIFEINDMSEGYDIWKQIADQLLAQGFYLGTYAEEPR